MVRDVLTVLLELVNFRIHVRIDMIKIVVGEIVLGMD
jgi:hypothetical protein